MKTLIKKEIRLLMPAWAGAMLLAIAPAWLIEWLLPHQNAAVYVPPPFFILPGLLLLGTASFGQEFSSNTFSLLLAQPLFRPRAWRLKISVLALAFILVLCTEFISWGLFVRAYPAYSRYFFDAFPGVSLWTLALFTGGLWTTLLLRQEIGAFWFTIIVPAVILAGVGILSDYLNFSENIDNWIGNIAVVVYSVAGFLFARHLFFRAQDTQWTGGNFFFFWRRRSRDRASFTFGQFRNRYIALFWKEIQLHDANLFLAAVLVVANLAVVFLLPHVSNRSLKTILEFIWALWLLMPLLIGCAAVAEERRMGIAESQLCQPVSRRVMFFLKFIVGLGLGVILGAVAPTLIEKTNNFGITDWPNYWIFYAAPVIFFISFYASTLSRSTAYAIGVAIAVTIVCCFGVLTTILLLFHVEPGLFQHPVELYDYFTYNNFGRAYLLEALCLLTSPFVVASLMYWNFKWLHQSWRLFRTNILTLLVSFLTVVILTNLIFYRTWEGLLPVESPHGAARLTTQSPVKLSWDSNIQLWNAFNVVLPDGRLWRQMITARHLDFGAMFWDGSEPKLDTSQYIGSNWVGISSDEFQTVGIQKNGSLWGISNWPSKNLTQIGSETNWSKAAGDGRGFLLLKTDGTIWIWGTNETLETWEKLKSDLTVQPCRIDAGTDWVSVVPMANSALVEKRDGSYWSWRPEFSKDGHYIAWNFVREQTLDDHWISFDYQCGYSVEVKTNGQLWFLSEIDRHWLNSLMDHGGDWSTMAIPRYTKKLRLGSESNWKVVDYGGFDSIILLKNDGTLWKWKGPWDKQFHPVQLGHYSDWLALTQGTALAADGSLWNWDQPSRHLWLAPSRRPDSMGNIFEGTNAAYQSTEIYIKAHEGVD